MRLSWLRPLAGDDFTKRANEEMTKTWMRPIDESKRTKTEV